MVEICNPGLFHGGVSVLLQLIVPTSSPLQFYFLITSVCLNRSVVRSGHFLQRFLPDDPGNQDEPHSPGQGG